MVKKDVFIEYVKETWGETSMSYLLLKHGHGIIRDIVPIETPFMEFIKRNGKNG